MTKTNHARIATAAMHVTAALLLAASVWSCSDMQETADKRVQLSEQADASAVVSSPQPAAIQTGETQISQSQPAPDPTAPQPQTDPALEPETQPMLPSGQFVGVSVGQRLVTSPDGVTWTDLVPFDQAVLDQGDLTAFRDVCVGGNHEVLAVGGGAGTVNGATVIAAFGQHSTDSGRTWKSIASKNPVSNFFSACAFGPSGKFLVQRGSTVGFLLQDNLYSMAIKTVGDYVFDGCGPNHGMLVYGEKGLVTVSECGFRAYSADGIVWTDQIGDAGGPLIAGAYGNGVFVVGGRTPDNAGMRLVRSSDGKTWTDEFTLAKGGSASQIIFADGKFYALVGKLLYSSKDGAQWEPTTLPYYFTTIAYGNGMFVAYSNGGGAVPASFYKSADTKTWVATQSSADTRGVSRLVWSP